VLALVEGNSWGWGSTEVVGLLAGSALALGAFVAIERRVKAPMVQFDLLSDRNFLGAVVVGCMESYLAGYLPQNDYLWVVKEDPKNPKLLYVGSELGLHVSFTGGNQWVRMHMKNLPPVAVRDLVIHPRDNDLILGTHGRSILIFDDVSFLQQMNDQVLGESAHLFGMRAALRFDGRGGFGGGLGSGGNKPFSGPNASYGAPITYYLKDKGPAKIEILEPEQIKPVLDALRGRPALTGSGNRTRHRYAAGRDCRATLARRRLRRRQDPGRALTGTDQRRARVQVAENRSWPTHYFDPAIGRH